MKEISDFTLDDIKEIDRALYETLDSIIFASIDTSFQYDSRGPISKFTLEQQTCFAMFLEHKLSSNESFRLKYWNVAKFLATNRSGYISLMLSFLKVNTVRCSRKMVRTQSKHLFLTFLNSFDSLTKKIQETDRNIWFEVYDMNQKTSQKNILNLCEKYYDKFSKVLGSF